MRVLTIASTRVRRPLAANQRARARPQQQKGYLLLELAVTLMLVGVIAIYTRSVALQEMDDGVAAATGTYVLAGAAGLETYMMANTTALMNATDVLGVGNDLQPTLAELQALTVNNSPLLPTTFAALSPTKQALQFDIQRIVNAKTGVTELRATACLNAPLKWRGALRDDLVTVAMRSMSGRGGRSMGADAGATIRGPLVTAGIPNPVAGKPVGILCSVNLLSDAFYSAFARQQDGRALSFTGVVNASGVVNATGTLGITTVAAGAACTTAGAIAWASSGTTYSPARCDGKTWVATNGLPISTKDAACSSAGALAAMSDGTPLICQGTGTSLAYVDFVSRMGGLVAMESKIVSNGSTVTKPICAVSAAKSAIYLFPMTDVQSEQVVYRGATGSNATEWTISILDANQVAIQGDALAMTYCVY